jgi:poly [ADP-ribose] polymerase
MAGGNVSADARQTVLDANNVEMREATKQEIDEIIRPMLGADGANLSRAWKVTNRKTEAAFEGYLDEVYKKKSKDDPDFKRYSIGDGVTRLFHGSRTHNWWSIICNGLYINPNQIKDLGHKADYCGSAFGHGIYTAPCAHKSMGYTDARGAGWTNGQADKGYLAIMKIATGEIYDIYGEHKGTPDNYQELQKMHPGADCTWAFAKRQGYDSSYLRNEEVIVYRQDQATIDFLVEYTVSATA